LREPYKTIIRALLKALKNTLGDKLVSLVVFGSVARGEARKDSDIDLLIIAQDLPKSKLARQDLFMKIEEKITNMLEELEKEGYYIDFSPILKTPKEALRLSPLYLDMVDDAVIVFDKNSFFEKILKRLNEKLKALGAQRVRLGKKWYWRLKEKYKLGEVISIE